MDNRRIVLASRPTGMPEEQHFRLETVPVPPLQPGEMLLRTIYLSLDPYMRGRMSSAPSYAAPVEVGGVMTAATVSRVEDSNLPEFAPGDWVVSQNGWQDYAVSNGTGVMKLDPRIPRPSYALGVLGMPGFTAYMGLLDIGQPKSGETVVVGAATGAVGSVVGQIAKLKGCRVVGIAGGAEKCQYAVEDLGFDACLDHRSPDLKPQLARACPNGIDVYFENVGGVVFDAVLPLLNPRARVPVCGLIAHYNDSRLPEGRDRTPLLMGTILRRRIRMQGFIIFQDYGPRFPEFFEQMLKWVESGAIKYREDIVDGPIDGPKNAGLENAGPKNAGLEKAPQAFIGLLQGKNFGKLVVRVAE